MMSSAAITDFNLKPAMAAKWYHLGSFPENFVRFGHDLVDQDLTVVPAKFVYSFI